MSNEEMPNILDQQEIQELSFEKAIGYLTDIVEKMESGQIPLQESISHYEQGMAIIGRCRKILADAEKKIEEIADGNK
jgi:exodeoxyribonuclease VII small subunit